VALRDCLSRCENITPSYAWRIEYWLTRQFNPEPPVKRLGQPAGFCIWYLSDFTSWSALFTLVRGRVFYELCLETAF